MNQNFIRTTDSPTATTLSKLGYKKVQDTDGIYVFLNTNTLKFSDDIDRTKIQYSNMLTF